MDVKFPVKRAKAGPVKFHLRMIIGSQGKKKTNPETPKGVMSHLLKLQTGIMCHCGETRKPLFNKT